MVHLQLLCYVTAGTGFSPVVNGQRDLQLPLLPRLLLFKQHATVAMTHMPVDSVQRLVDSTPAAVHTAASLTFCPLAVVVHDANVCRKQVQGSLKFILGIPTISSTLGLALAQQLLGRTPSSWLPDTASEALLQLLLLAVLADFGLYWGKQEAGRLAGSSSLCLHDIMTCTGAAAAFSSAVEFLSVLAGMIDVYHAGTCAQPVS